MENINAENALEFSENPKLPSPRFSQKVFSFPQGSPVRAQSAVDMSHIFLDVSRKSRSPQPRSKNHKFIIFVTNKFATSFIKTSRLGSVQWLGKSSPLTALCHPGGKKAHKRKNITLKGLIFTCTNFRGY